MDHAEFAEFAERWVDDWNRHDLDAVLAHYGDDAMVTSPLAALRVPESGGVVRGRAALHEYWSPALREQHDLHFDLVETLCTVAGGTILYRNQRGQLVAETLLFAADGLVHSAVVAYTES